MSKPTQDSIPNFTILNLNRDCLIKIFEFLTIYELISVEKVNDIFKSTCESVYKSKSFHKLRLELRSLEKEYFKDLQIFDRIGQSLRAFEFSGGYIMNEAIKQTIIDGVANSCTKLESFSINYVKLTNEDFIQLEKLFCNLTTLDLSRCGIDESLLGNIELDGERLKSVKTLKLTGNTCMIGSFFKNMKHVEVLDVSYCFSLCFYEFTEFLRNCRNLVDLNVSASCKLVSESSSFLETVFTYQPEIEKLFMDNTGAVRDDQEIAKFTKLKFSSFEGRKFGT